MIEPPLGYTFIGPYAVPKPPKPLVSRIQETAARHFQMSVLRLIGPSRGPADVVRARQVAMHVARHLTRQSYHLLGEKFGGRDHSTVRASIQQATGRMEVDPDFAADWHAIASRFGVP